MERNGVQSVDPGKNNTFRQTFYIFLLGPNADNYATIDRARKCGIGGVKGTTVSINKKVVTAVEAFFSILDKEWNLLTQWLC